MILKVACAWDGLVGRRELEKRKKYDPLKADQAVTNEGYTVSVIPVVMGALGTAGAIRQQLARTQVLDKEDCWKTAKKIQKEAWSQLYR